MSRGLKVLADHCTTPNSSAKTMLTKPITPVPRVNSSSASRPLSTVGPSGTRGKRQSGSESEPDRRAQQLHKACA
jgi:hypothetical protein